MRKIIRDGETLKGFLDQVIKETIRSRRPVLSEESDKEALTTGKVSLDDVVEKLNVIRSGRSLKDEEVLSAMQKYLDELDTAEKTALLSFLKGISEVMTAGVSGEEAYEPSEAKVKMEKKPSSQSVTIKPRVIKKPSSENKGSKKSEEDTTPPVPIEPKKK